MPTPATPITNQEPLRNISDTALSAAVFRGWENKRPDALFRDPYAERLARERSARDTMRHVNARAQKRFLACYEELGWFWMPPGGMNSRTGCSVLSSMPAPGFSTFTTI
jgi:hypothetical protein